MNLFQCGTNNTFFLECHCWDLNLLRIYDRCNRNGVQQNATQMMQKQNVSPYSELKQLQISHRKETNVHKIHKGGLLPIISNLFFPSSLLAWYNWLVSQEINPPSQEIRNWYLGNHMKPRHQCHWGISALAIISNQLLTCTHACMLKSPHTLHAQTVIKKSGSGCSMTTV